MDLIQFLLSAINGWPLIFYVVGISLVCTLALGFIQLRYFAYAWKLVLFPPKQKSNAKADMTPFQAFINTLSTNLGNGSLAGMATAVHQGGPGAAIWVMVIGFLLMAVRFCEVFLSVSFGAQAHKQEGLGGPMLYLRSVFAGRYLSYIYAFLCLIFMALGSAIQSNSIGISLATTWEIPVLSTAIGLLLFIMYVVFGGAARIVKVSDRIVPLKVAVFFISAFIVLFFHRASLLTAIHTMFSLAFTWKAMIGGALGFSIQQAMRYGILRSILATESGLGTAAILFSSTGSSEPVKDGIISMLSTFLSTFVCFIVALCIVVSGADYASLTSTELTISSFSTVFGVYGGWVVSFLSVSFGMGVLVSYSYITREVWLNLLRGRFLFFFPIAFSAVVFAGALVTVDFVFGFADIIMAVMLFINLFGIMYLLPRIQSAVKTFARG